ncbi:hypothetical protein D3C86_2037460 [compost metagenome]
MVAWAMEPMMSWRYRRLSKSTDAVKRATKASTGSLKRPPQDWLVLSVLMGSLGADGERKPMGRKIPSIITVLPEKPARPVRSGARQFAGVFTEVPRD